MCDFSLYGRIKEWLIRITATDAIDLGNEVLTLLRGISESEKIALVDVIGHHALVEVLPLLDCSADPPRRRHGTIICSRPWAEGTR
jgi:hypothetical protein